MPPASVPRQRSEITGWLKSEGVDVNLGAEVEEIAAVDGSARGAGRNRPVRKLGWS